MLDPTGYWIVTVESGEISERNPAGSAWDVAGGLPDPYVCLTINGSRRCTPTRSDTLMPVWNTAFAPATATALQVGVMAEIWDEDLSDDDPICGKGLLTVTQADMLRGRWGGGCGVGRFTATLEPR